MKHLSLEVVRRGVAGVALLAAAIYAGGWIDPPPAQAQWAVECINCSDWWTQLTQYAEEIDTAVNTAESYAEEILMDEQLVKAGLALPGQVWGQVQQDLNALNQIVASGSNIAYATANIAQQFQKTFPTYSTNMATPITQPSASAQLSAWAQQTYDAASTSLQAASSQSSQMDSENSAMATLEGQSTEAAGQMQAIQAGNEMAAQQVQQLQKLRQLVMAQMDMQSQVMATQAAQAEQQRAVTQQFLVDPSTVPTGGQADTGGLDSFPTH